MLAITLQVILVVVMIHGVKTERKSFLMPYIVYAAIAVLTGTAGVCLSSPYLILRIFVS
jgi:ABC-type polysaccharide/polyol phosphate export permease